MQTIEGFIDFKGYKTWYSLYGDLDSEVTPLLVIHGGPGYPHYYLEDLGNLSRNGQPVIFYDQLGCGKSDRPDNPGLWTIGLFVDELNTLRKSLGLQNISILGQSWGGTLGLEYMFTKPDGVQKLILADPLVDTKLWVEEAKRLIGELPKWATDIMVENETKGTTDSPEYKKAYAEFARRHICRIEPHPTGVVKSDVEFGRQPYNVMWGPSETKITGTLRDWTSLDRISQIDVPTLFMSGKFDEATPKQIETAHKLLPNSEWVLFENSSHMPHLEEPEKYLKTVKNFLGSTTARKSN
jgi:proline-specific peptidase